MALAFHKDLWASPFFCVWRELPLIFSSPFRNSEWRCANTTCLLMRLLQANAFQSITLRTVSNDFSDDTLFVRRNAIPVYPGLSGGRILSGRHQVSPVWRGRLTPLTCIAGCARFSFFEKNFCRLSPFQFSLLLHLCVCLPRNGALKQM